MKILAMIPAYNEEGNIERVVNDILTNAPGTDFVVINDGSTDSTADICRRNGYPLINLPVNLGLAGAFQAGVRYAYEHHYDAALQFDGDNQHRAEYIADMSRVMQEQASDIVIGSRFCTEKKPRSMRMLGSNLIAFAIRIASGQKICDPTSGMRMFDAKMLERLAHNMNYGPEPDTISYLIRTGAKVTEVQVSMRERFSGESYLTVTKSMKYMLNMFVSILFLQPMRPRR